MINMTDLRQKKYIRNYQVVSDSIPLCSFLPIFCDVMAKSFEGETSVTTHVTLKTFSIAV